jgi:hypothetical protein
MPMTCYECGTGGHVARDCPNIEQLGGGHPMWCGTCDRRTRHWYDTDGRVHRCQCHGLSHLPLAQHARCGRCKQTIYEWDQADCGNHQPVGVQLTPARPGDKRKVIGGPWLDPACPWCKRPSGGPCINVGTGENCPPHAARLEAAGLEPVAAPQLRDLAAAQLADLRAAPVL